MTKSGPERAYRAGTHLFSLAILLLGLAMVIMTLVRGGGVTSLGLIMGVLFIALGTARMYLLRR